MSSPAKSLIFDMLIPLIVIDVFVADIFCW
jgi:hypothetical protein